MPSSHSRPSAPHGATPASVAADATRSAAAPRTRAHAGRHPTSRRRAPGRAQRPSRSAITSERAVGHRASLRAWSSPRSRAASTSRSEGRARASPRRRAANGTPAEGVPKWNSRPGRPWPAGVPALEPASVGEVDREGPRGHRARVLHFQGSATMVRRCRANASPCRSSSEKPTIGSRRVRRLRKEGLIPGVLYGKDHSRAIVVGERELRAALTGPSGPPRDRRRRDRGTEDPAPRGAQGLPAAPDPRAR